MGDYHHLNGDTMAEDDLEKRRGFEGEQQQHQDLEEGEETEDARDVEKAEEIILDVEVPELLEPLLTPHETQHEKLAAAAKPLILTEKVIVSVLVVCFVLVEAYFVGRSFRHWLDDNNEHLHLVVNSTTNTDVFPKPLPLELADIVLTEGKDATGGVKQSNIQTPEPFEDFLEGSLDSGYGTMTESFADAAVAQKTSSKERVRGPSTADIDPQHLVLPLMEEAGDGEAAPGVKSTTSTRRTRFPPDVTLNSINQQLLVLPLMAEAEAVDDNGDGETSLN